MRIAYKDLIHIRAYGLQAAWQVMLQLPVKLVAYMIGLGVACIPAANYAHTSELLFI